MGPLLPIIDQGNLQMVGSGLKKSTASHDSSELPITSASLSNFS